MSHLASYNGEYQIAIGNVIGSNVANSYLVLGLCALVTPLSLDGKDLRKQIFVLIIVHLFMAFGLYFLGISYSLAIGFMLIFVYYLYVTLFKASEEEESCDHLEVNVTKIDYLKLLSGFVILYVSGRTSCEVR